MIPDIDPDVAAFRSAIGDLMRARDVRQLVRDEMRADGFNMDLWFTAAKDLGVQGLLVPEAQGGSGHELAAAAVAVEELEGRLAPGPYRSTLAAAAALAKVDERFAQEALAAIADGTQVTLFADRTDGAFLQLVSPGEGRFSVAGLVVPYGGVADRIVLVVRANDETFVCCLDPRSAGVEIQPTVPFDLTRPGAVLTCAAASVQMAKIAPDRAAFIADTSLLLVAAEQLGVIRVSLDRTLEYLRDRYAFGRPVASFQGIKHQLALLHCDVERAVALLDNAVAAMARSADERRRAVLTARAVLGPMAVHIASEALRLRGGIGYTWEDDSHLFFRRARSLEHAAIDPYAVREELAGVLELR